LTLGDFNGDGNLDLAALERDSLWILLNDGTGNLVNSGFYLPCENSNGVTTGDLDQDGDLDLIVSERYSGPMVFTRRGKVWLNEGTRYACSGVCGDGQVTPSEQCDGDNLNGESCSSLLGWSGILRCDPLTCEFDTSDCH
jgi:cysteine-rich repeat protein